ncbi:MAG: alanine racemase [Acidimicrobiales bacterium]
MIDARKLGDRVEPWLEIQAGNVAWNLAQVRCRVGETPVMAVVKCNAYGHGSVEMAQILADAGVQDFAVVKIAEAIALRSSGIDQRILNFGSFSASDAETLVDLGICQSVFSGSIEWLANAAQQLGKPARVHIKVDAGMSRVGVPHEEAISFIEDAHRMPGVVIDGVFTTLTEEPEFDLVQVDRLKKICQQAATLDISVGTVHAASSSGVVDRPAAYLDMVRPGNALYGFEQLSGLDLRPTLSMHTRVVLVKTLPAGATLGYHRVRQIEREMKLATLPVGYADGFPASAVDAAEVLIGGRRWPVVGYISANHTLVDITGSDIVENDGVVLFGTQEQARISLAEVAGWTGLSAYQFATGLSPMLPRSVLGRDELAPRI